MRRARTGRSGAIGILTHPGLAPASSRGNRRRRSCWGLCVARGARRHRRPLCPGCHRWEHQRVTTIVATAWCRLPRWSLVTFPALLLLAGRRWVGHDNRGDGCQTVSVEQPPQAVRWERRTVVATLRCTPQADDATAARVGIKPDAGGASTSEASAGIARTTSRGCRGGTAAGREGAKVGARAFAFTGGAEGVGSKNATSGGAEPTMESFGRVTAGIALSQGPRLHRRASLLQLRLSCRQPGRQRPSCRQPRRQGHLCAPPGGVRCASRGGADRGVGTSSAVHSC